MSTPSQLADDVRALAKPFRSVIALADYLDQIGSIENQTKEAEAARDKAVAEREGALHALSDAAAQLGNAKKLVTGTQDDAAQIIADAQVGAAKIVEDATAEGASIVAQCESDAKQIAVQTAQASQTLLDTLQKVGVARGELADLTAKVAAVKAELTKFIN